MYYKDAVCYEEIREALRLAGFEGVLGDVFSRSGLGDCPLMLDVPLGFVLFFFFPCLLVVFVEYVITLPVSFSAFLSASETNRQTLWNLHLILFREILSYIKISCNFDLFTFFSALFVIGLFHGNLIISFIEDHKLIMKLGYCFQLKIINSYRRENYYCSGFCQTLGYSE